MKLPIYIFTGFLEGGKTSIIQESLNDKNFNSGEKTLIIMCEQGVEELDPTKFWGQNVYIEYIEDEDEITEAKLSALCAKHKLDRVIIEYNGMWMLDTLYSNMPSNWEIYQNMMFADANSFLNYNSNMRQLTFDKVKDAEMVVLNRASDSIDKEEIHRIIRGISRRAAIVYDYPDGHVEYDDIEDPLPFDIEADVIEIHDDDYALWYRDLSENLQNYAKKTIRFKGMVAKDERLPNDSLIIGRHIMTCCEADVQFGGIVAKFSGASKMKTKDWVTVTGTIMLESHMLYKSKGPVLYIESTDFAVAPKQEIATFY